MYTIAILDNNMKDIEIMEKYLFSYCSSHSIKYIIDKYTDSLQFSFLKKYDIIFLNAGMKEKNGISLAKEINQHYKTKIIFTSSNTCYLHLTLDVRPFHFIHKEYIKDEINHVLDLAFTNESSIITINKQTIDTQNIIYINIEDHLCYIHTLDEVVATWMSLKKISNMLNKSLFIKVNRSTLVNINYIKSIQENTLITVDNAVHKLTKNVYKALIGYIEQE